jgi:O-antigen/teichoic acid export membrane protein
MHTMGDVGASALGYVWGLLWDLLSQLNTADVATVLIFVVVLVATRIALPRIATWARMRAVKVAHGHYESFFELYSRRFTVRGFKFETCRYSLWLAFALWLHVFLILSLWPSWVGVGIIALSALAVVLTMSVLGYRTRSTGDIRRFGIFYEPSFALVSTFLMGKLPDLASRVFSKFAALFV